MVVVVVAVLIATVIAFLPASLIDGRIASMTQGKVRLADAAGTVWDGRGILTDGAGTWRLPLGWTISRADVLRGVHAVALHPVDGASIPSGTVEVVDNGVRVRALQVELPAQAIFGALPMRPMPAFGGTIAVAASDLAWNQEAHTGGLEAHWRGARVASGDNVADLGTVDLAAAPQDSRLVGKMTNSGGDVRVDGTVNIAAGTVAVDATVTPTPGAPANIARALASVGTPDANGTVRIGWRGNLR
jgi:Type II secretion system (T2SS), protein N